MGKLYTKIIQFKKEESEKKEYEKSYRMHKIIRKKNTGKNGYGA